MNAMNEFHFEKFSEWIRNGLEDAGRKRQNPGRLDFISDLFRNFERKTANFSEDEVAEGLRGFVHPGRDEGALLIYDGNIPLQNRASAVRNLEGVFDYLGRKCLINLNSRRGSPLSPLNELCRDWWDIFPAHPLSVDPERRCLDHEFLAVFEKMASAHSPVIQEAALHGLGHWQHAYPVLIGKTIDAYLERNVKADPLLRKYAVAARQGLVH